MTGETTSKSTNIIVLPRQMTNFFFRELRLVLQCRLKMGHGWDRCRLFKSLSFFQLTVFLDPWFSTWRWPHLVPLQVSQNMVPVDCPPGLEYLALIDQLIIKQKVMLYRIKIIHQLPALILWFLQPWQCLYVFQNRSRHWKPSPVWWATASKRQTSTKSRTHSDRWIIPNHNF